MVLDTTAACVPAARLLMVYGRAHPCPTARGGCAGVLPLKNLNQIHHVEAESVDQRMV